MYVGIIGWYLSLLNLSWGFPGGSVVEKLPANAGNVDSIPGPGRSPGEGNDSPLQDSCLENPIQTGMIQSMVFQTVGHNLATEQQQQQLYLEYSPFAVFQLSQTKIWIWCWTHGSSCRELCPNGKKPHSWPQKWIDYSNRCYVCSSWCYTVKFAWNSGAKRLG